MPFVLLFICYNRDNAMPTSSSYRVHKFDACGGVNVYLCTDAYMYAIPV